MINFFKKNIISELNGVLIQKFFIDNTIKKEYLYNLGYNNEIKKHFSYSIIHVKNEIKMTNDLIYGIIKEDIKNIYFTIQVETKNEIMINYFSDFPLKCYTQFSDINITLHNIKLTIHPDNIDIRYLTIYHQEYIVYCSVPNLISISSQIDINDFTTNFLLIDENLNVYKIDKVLIHKQTNKEKLYYVNYLQNKKITIQELKEIVNFDSLKNLTTITNINDLFNLLETNQQKNKYITTYKSL